MGRKALVDFSLIKEICENLKSNQKKFKGQLDLEPEDGSTKAVKKAKAVKRLLVSAAEKKDKEKLARKKRKKSPERFRQAPTEDSESSFSSTCPSSDSENATTDFESETDDQCQEDVNSGDSDLASDTNGETE